MLDFGLWAREFHGGFSFLGFDKMVVNVKNPELHLVSGTSCAVAAQVCITIDSWSTDIHSY